MATSSLPGGTVHTLPADMRNELLKNKKALAIWPTLTPLARNEWTCWTISVKKQETRDEHREQMISKLNQGSRRPCCWMGCIHRTDKKLSPSVRGVLKKKGR